MKILIVDDEHLARERLMRLLKDMDQAVQIAEASNGLEAIEQVNQHEPDVVLMDIRMPGMDGIEAATHLTASDKAPAIIFTTAFDEYALKAFDAQAVDYLLKPIRQEKLKNALDKCRKLNKVQLEQIELQQQGHSSRSHISAQIRGTISLIPTHAIYCFIADNKYITVKYEKQGQLTETVIEDTLKSLEEEFSQDFFRIHRNALVRIDKIEALQKQGDGHVLLKLTNIEHGLEVSRRHLSQLRKLMKSK